LLDDPFRLRTQSLRFLSLWNTGSMWRRRSWQEYHSSMCTCSSECQSWWNRTCLYYSYLIIHWLKAFNLYRLKLMITD
jgi:hypothetical protein